MCVCVCVWAARGGPTRALLAPQTFNTCKSIGYLGPRCADGHVCIVCM